MSEHTAQVPETQAPEGTAAMARAHVLKCWGAQAEWDPIEVTDGEGCWLIARDGRRFLDLAAGHECLQLGYRHPRVVEAICGQAGRLPYVADDFAAGPVADLGRMLAEIAPGDLRKTFFSTGGAEAVEAAVKIARRYTGAHKIISRYRSYHGATYGAMSVGGDPRRWYMGASTVPGVVFAPDAYRYRCPFCRNAPECTLECAEYIRFMIEHEGGARHVAAVLIEPIVGTQGVIVPPDGYLRRVREICDETGVLLIIDEVMTGIGRTGTWFAVEHWGVAPDIMILAKGLSSGYIPLGATMVSGRIAQHFETHPLGHGATFANHPLACAAGVAVIETIRDEGLLERTRVLGEMWARELHGLAARHPSVGEVRGKGQMWFVELVRNRATREPMRRLAEKFDPSNVIARMAAGAFRRGVFIPDDKFGIWITPPLVIAEDEIRLAVEVFDQVLEMADACVEP